jgi:hypothetical protein
MRIKLVIVAAAVVGATIAAVAYREVWSRPPSDEARWAGAVGRLRSPEPGDRRAAAEALARLASGEDFWGEARSPEQARALRADLAGIAGIVAQKAEGAKVRTALVRVLGAPRLRDRSFATMPPLADVIRDESDDPRVRAEVLSCLAPIGPRPAFRGAVLAAVASPSAAPRAAAYRVLDAMRLKPETLLPILDRGLGDPEEAVRLASTELAGDLAEKDVPGALGLLLRGFHGPLPTVRRLALVRLRLLGSKSAAVAPQVARALRTTTDPVFRLELATALAELTGDPDAYLPYMIAGLRAKDFPTWQPATTALMYAWRRGARADARVPALRAVLDDDRADPDARARAAVALAVITNRPGAYEPWIDRGLASRDRMTRAWVGLWGRAALRRPLRLASPKPKPKTRGITPLGAAAAVVGVAVFVWFDMKRFVRRAGRDRRTFSLTPGPVPGDPGPIDPDPVA